MMPHSHIDCCSKCVVSFPGSPAKERGEPGNEISKYEDMD